MLDTWIGMDGIADILLTQGLGSQLFLLFNHDQIPFGASGIGTGSRGAVYSYGRLRKGPVVTPVSGITFPTLFNPIAICGGGDGLGSPANRLYVLDRGDTCLARSNPVTHAC